MTAVDIKLVHMIAALQ